MMRTDTYDPELWQLVPKEPTDYMINSTHAKYGFPGGSAKTYLRGYKAYLAAAPTPPSSAQSEAKFDPPLTRAHIVALRRIWLEENDPADDTDVVTPYDELLYNFSGGTR